MVFHQFRKFIEAKSEFSLENSLNDLNKICEGITGSEKTESETPIDPSYERISKFFIREKDIIIKNLFSATTDLNWGHYWTVIFSLADNVDGGILKKFENFYNMQPETTEIL